MGILGEFNLYKCDNCDSNGFIIASNIATKCNCRKKYEYELKASGILCKSGLLDENSNYEDFKKLMDFDWSDYRGEDEGGNIKKLRKYVDEFDNPNKPFDRLHCYVWGGQGTQKSYTLKGMLAKLACKGKSVHYIFAKDLISLLHDSERDDELREKLDYIKNVDVLVIDEFEENRCCLWASGYKERLLIVWLKDRLEVVRKSTWFISNDSMEGQKASKFGELFGDMLERECRYGMFEFKDKFSNYITKEEIEQKMKNIWED